MVSLRISELYNNYNWLSGTRRWPLILSWALILLGPILVIVTVYAMQAGLSGHRANFVGGIFLIDTIYLFIVALLVGFSVARIFFARRAQSAGSRLHLRLAWFFALVAFFPSILLAVFAVLTLSFGVESWFSQNVKNMVSSSVKAANAYKIEQRESVESDLIFMAFQLEQYKKNTPFVTDGDARIQITRLQAVLQGDIKEAYLIDGKGDLRSRGNNSYLFDYEQPSEDELEQAQAGAIIIIEDWQNNEFRALKRLNEFVDRYLYISHRVDGKILLLLDETTDTAIAYEELESNQFQLFSFYGLLYLGFALFVILSSIWVGLRFAERVSTPIGQLASAATKVGDGDFDVIVEEEKGEDEIATLGRVFNWMIVQVKRQRDDLIATHKETDERRRLFDSVLSNVTAGIIGLDALGYVRVLNIAAKKLLNLDHDAEGAHITKAVPEFAQLYNSIISSDRFSAEREIHLARAHTSEVLLVRIVVRKSEEGDQEGYVISFDDVTSLVSAQRMAAWGDVARRIAHEIKNPLTPIQLSAERLSQKYALVVGEESDNLKQYCQVIIRQTNDLRRIVDEFSKFARMPRPKFHHRNLIPLMREIIVLFEENESQIIISFIHPNKPVEIMLDSTLIRQAFTNLIKNAKESIETYIKNNTLSHYKPEIRITIIENKKQIEILVSDNGIGFPVENRSRLFEPYVTQREKGTGLGLSIVKKIIEEHNGTLELQDAPIFDQGDHYGAQVRIVFMSLSKDIAEKNTSFTNSKEL